MKPAHRWRSLRLFSALMLFALAAAAEEQPCDVAVVARVLKGSLQLSFGAGEDSGDIVGMACKPHPGDANRTVVALFHVNKDKSGVPVEHEAGFVMAVLDARRGKLIALHRETIVEDATIRVLGGALPWIDTGRYVLAPGVRAIGVRMDIGYGPRCAEGGASGFLTLFTQDGSRLVPVLKDLPTTVWRREGMNPACGNVEGAYSTQMAAITVALGSGIANGRRDLQLAAVVTTEASTGHGAPIAKPGVRQRRLATLRYDGRSYGADMWAHAFAALD